MDVTKFKRVEEKQGIEYPDIRSSMKPVRHNEDEDHSSYIPNINLDLYETVISCK